MTYLFFLISLITFFLFLNTMPPTIYLGDSGEIVVATYTLGIGHPPGYPLYILAGKIFTMIPLGDIAFRMNLFSTVLSLFVFILFVITLQIIIEFFSDNDKKKLIFIVSLIISFFYIYSETLWFQAINAKGGIYIFSHLVVLFSFYTFFKFVKTKNIKYSYLSFYITGFLIPSHSSTALLVILIIGLNFYFLRKQINLISALKLLLFFIFSFITSYLFLFIRAKTEPVLDWAGITTFKEVFEHIIRKRYFSGGQFSFSILFLRLNHYIIQFIKNYNILIIFFLIGLYYIYKTNKKIFFITITFIFLNTFFLIYGIETSAGFNLSSLTTISLYISRGFYLINDLLPIIISAIGLYYILYLLNKKYNINIIFMGIIILLFPIITSFNNYEINNHSRKFFGYDHAMNIMKTLNKDDILFSKNDCPSFNILYIKYVKKKFLDNIVYDRDYAVLDISIYNKKTDIKKMREIEIDFILKNPNNTFFTEVFHEKDKNIESKPYGILFKPYLSDKSLSLNTKSLLNLYSLRDYFNNKNLDLFYRDFIAKYFIAKSEYMILMNKNTDAIKIINFIEKFAGNSPATISDLIRITFWGLKDIELSLRFLKKMVYLNPYDIKLLKILLQAYFKYNFEEALIWTEEFYKYLPNSKYKKELKKQLELFKQIRKDNTQ